MKNIIKNSFTCLLFTIAFNFCNAQSLNQLLNYMTGSFNIEKQAIADGNYYNISLEMQPIWKKDKRAKWLYVEQAIATKKNKPYQQQIYKLTQTSENTFESAVYLLPKPKKFDKTCPSKLRGSTYATSEVKIYKNILESWDGSFNEKNENICDAENGVYIFSKLNFKQIDI